jgi:hypothetical protein
VPERVLFVTFDLFLDGLGGVQPVLDVVDVSVLQPEIVLLNQVQRVEDLLVQVPGLGLFLQQLTGRTGGN